jgi:RNA polymerase sigma-B factor
MGALSCESDSELARRYRETRNPEYREALILRHTGLARSIARRYAGRGLPYEDIVQTGYMGLIGAVDRYDPTRGVPLHAYAARVIEGEIMHLFRDHGWAVRVPRTLQELGRRLAKASEQLSHEIGRTPTTAELAVAAGVTEDQVHEAAAVQQAFFAQPLNEPTGTGEDWTPQMPLGFDDRGFEIAEDHEALAKAMRHLPARERTILGMRFFEGLSQSEIAARMGISQMHVSRLLRATLEELRARIGADYAAA